MITNIRNPIYITSQKPLDIKVWFNTESELVSSVMVDNKALQYHKGMFAYVIESYKIYRWVEWDISSGVQGLLPNGYTYPTCWDSDDYIEYAGKTFNFIDLGASLGVIQNFIGLYDTPNSYAGQANNLVVVNPTATGLVFTDTLRKPIRYLQDFSSNFTSRSLVDKGYVDNEIDKLKVQNGLTELSDKRTFELGGNLIKNTVINGGLVNSFQFLDLKGFYVSANDDINISIDYGNSINLKTGNIDISPNGFKYTNNPTFLNNSLITKQYSDTQDNDLVQNRILSSNGITKVNNISGVPYTTLKLGGNLSENTTINTNNNSFNINGNNCQLDLNNLKSTSGINVFDLKNLRLDNNGVIKTLPDKSRGSNAVNALSTNLFMNETKYRSSFAITGTGINNMQYNLQFHHIHNNLYLLEGTISAGTTPANYTSLQFPEFLRNKILPGSLLTSDYTGSFYSTGTTLIDYLFRMYYNVTDNTPYFNFFFYNKTSNSSLNLQAGTYRLSNVVNFNCTFRYKVGIKLLDSQNNIVNNLSVLLHGVSLPFNSSHGFYTDNVYRNQGNYVLSIQGFPGFSISLNNDTYRLSENLITNTDDFIVLTFYV